LGRTAWWAREKSQLLASPITYNKVGPYKSL
jgi:hypothetical protein